MYLLFAQCDSIDKASNSAIFQLETSPEVSQKRTESPTSAPPGVMEDGLQHNYGYEVMQCVSPKGSDASGHLERPDSPYLVLKDPSPSALGGTVNLILSFSNSGDTQVQVQTPGREGGVPVPEPVHRVRMIKHHSHTQSNPVPLYMLLCVWYPSQSPHISFSFLKNTLLCFILFCVPLQPAETHSSACKSFWKRCQGLFGNLKRKKKIYRHSAEEVNIVGRWPCTSKHRNMVIVCSAG